MVPVVTSGMAGQPGMLMIGLSVMISETPRAPVGLGLALGMPPKAAQFPTAMIAAAPSAASRRTSRLLRPPIVQ